MLSLSIHQSVEEGFCCAHSAVMGSPWWTFLPLICEISFWTHWYFRPSCGSESYSLRSVKAFFLCLFVLNTIPMMVGVVMLLSSYASGEQLISSSSSYCFVPFCHIPSELSHFQAKPLLIPHSKSLPLKLIILASSSIMLLWDEATRTAWSI